MPFDALREFSLSNFYRIARIDGAWFDHSQRRSASEILLEVAMQERSLRVRFGSFELDSHSGELRKNGLRIRIEDQPFRLLLALLERPGEVVTREELTKAIWPAG